MASSFCESPSQCSETFQKSFPSFGVLVSNDLMELIDEEKEKKFLEEKEGEGEKIFKGNKKERDHASTPSSPLFAHLTTMDELLNHVKNYIVKHQLYDPANPLKIMVHQNALGSLLGKQEFSLLDVRDILLDTCAFPVTETNSSEVICSISEKKVPKKRKFDTNKNDSLSEFSAKRIKNFFESDESMHSYQDYETDCVKDSTSEDNFSLNGLIIAETFDVDVEYEIERDEGESLDGGEYSACSYDSESDLEDFVKSAIISFIAQTTDSDIEYLADRSSDEETELELSEEDKWKCHSCGTLNDPVVGCCCVCWQRRLGWWSERSESEMDFSRKNRRKEFLRKTHKKNKRKLSRKRESNKNKGSNCKTSDIPSATESLSPASSSSFCNDNSDANLSDLSSAPTTVSLSSPSTSCNNSSDVIIPSNTHEESDVIKTEVEKQLCLFCCSKPADSTIIHGKLGCRVCCFTCGKKVFSENERCPVCRRLIERIVYLYNL